MVDIFQSKFLDALSPCDAMPKIKSNCMLTYWSLNKLAAILQTTFSKARYRNRIYILLPFL